MSIQSVISFLEYAKSKEIIRGGNTYYDIHGYYKYLTISELFDHYFNNKR